MIPHHLLPLPLRPVAKVGLLVGHFVLGVAQLNESGTDGASGRRGRPRKGESVQTKASGRFGGQARKVPLMTKLREHVGARLFSQHPGPFVQQRCGPTVSCLHLGSANYQQRQNTARQASKGSASLNTEVKL